MRSWLNPTELKELSSKISTGRMGTKFLFLLRGTLATPGLFIKWLYQGKNTEIKC